MPDVFNLEGRLYQTFNWVFPLRYGPPIVIQSPDFVLQEILLNSNEKA